MKIDDHDHPLSTEEEKRWRLLLLSLELNSEPTEPKAKNSKKLRCKTPRLDGTEQFSKTAYDAVDCCNALATARTANFRK